MKALQVTTAALVVLVVGLGGCSGGDTAGTGGSGSGGTLGGDTGGGTGAATSGGGSGNGTSGAGGSAAGGGTETGYVPRPADGELVELADPMALPAEGFVSVSIFARGTSFVDVSAAFLGISCTRVELEGSCFTRRCDAAPDTEASVTFSSPGAAEPVIGNYGELAGTFAPGDLVSVVSAGTATWPAFQASAALPADVELTSSTSGFPEIVPGVDYTFTWSGGGDSHVVVRLPADGTGAGNIRDSTFCAFPAAAGTATVPGSVLTEAGYPEVSLVDATLLGVDGTSVKLWSARSL